MTPVRPITIAGETITPKWPWSRQYAAAVCETLTAETPAERDRARATEAEYARAWAAKRGLPCGDVDAVLVRIRAEQGGEG